MGPMIDPAQWQAFLQNMPIEEREKLLQALTSDYTGQGELLNEQLATANELRGTAMPEGRSAGQIYVSASPFEFADAAVQRYQGDKERTQAREGLRGLGEQRSSALQKLQAAILGGGATRKPKFDQYEGL